MEHGSTDGGSRRLLGMGIQWVSFTYNPSICAWNCFFCIARKVACAIFPHFVKFARSLQTTKARVTLVASFYALPICFALFTQFVTVASTSLTNAEALSTLSAKYSRRHFFAIYFSLDDTGEFSVLTFVELWFSVNTTRGDWEFQQIFTFLAGLNWVAARS